MGIHTIKQALQALQKGSLSVEELCQKCLMIQKKTKCLNMYVSEMDLVNQDLEASTRAYAQGSARLLEGIPVAMKDNFCTKDVTTSCGSKMLLNYKPPYNSTMVSRVQDNGGVIIGKTNMDEFAMGSGTLDGCHGPAVNPWNLVGKSKGEPDNRVWHPPNDGSWHICGGSSGGSAAAVASGSCLAAFGSDTGGSVRNPASYCGVVGLKPTYGLLSRHGLVPLVNSLDVPGIFTRTVEDCSIILNVVAGHDMKDSTTVTEPHTPFHINEHLDVSTLHIGIPQEYHGPGLSEEVLDLWRDTADDLERAGAKVSRVSMPHTQTCINCYHVLCCCEVASNMARYDGVEFGLRDGNEDSTEELYASTRHKGFNEVVRSRILAGNYFLLKRNYEQFFLQAQKVRRLISNDFKTVFGSGVDFLLTPVTLTDAPLYSWFSDQDNRTRCQEQDIFTTPANMAGVPAMSLPLRLSPRGLPLSLQLIGPHFSEAGILSLGHWLENHFQFEHLDLEDEHMSGQS